MIKETIILAGGLGTRLRSVVADLPKCMARVAGKPFLHYVIQYLQKQGVDKFIFSLGYKHESVTAYIHEQYPLLLAQFTIEDEPLGTGGAITAACKLSTEKNVFIVNGDTLFSADLKLLAAFHKACKADCTLALKPMQQFNRYGVVELDKKHRITSFREKKFYKKGLINGGLYVLQPQKILREPFPGKFSFEKDYLEQYIGHHKMYGMVQDEYFIDIGIPEDYERAQAELGNY